MTSEHDPVLSAQIISIIINCVFLTALWLARFSFNRSITKRDQADELARTQHEAFDRRLRTLEKEAVTHADLQRLENKIDNYNNEVTKRLDRILDMKINK